MIWCILAIVLIDIQSGANKVTPVETGIKNKIYSSMVIADDRINISLILCVDCTD